MTGFLCEPSIVTTLPLLHGDREAARVGTVERARGFDDRGGAAEAGSDHTFEIVEASRHRYRSEQEPEPESTEPNLNREPDLNTPRRIIGGGFGGLDAARALRGADVRVTLLDRHNYHLFQPLLYQVATASLSPGDVASPIRWILRRQKNVEVLLAEAREIDPVGRRVDRVDARTGWRSRRRTIGTTT